MTTSTRENGLRHDIERTREQLGGTLEALAHKVDVPARVKNKVHDAKKTVQVKAEEVKQHVHEGTEALHAKAGEVTGQAQRLTHQAVTKLPPPVATRIEPLMATARRRPLPTAAVGVGLLVALLLVLGRLLYRST